jgi:hypothetical protein
MRSLRLSAAVGDLIGIDDVLIMDRKLLVTIDVRPGHDPNYVNLFQLHSLAVAVLGSDSLDVDDVDSDSLVFGPHGAPITHAAPHYYDANDDGYVDLVGHFRVWQSGIAFGDTDVCLSGEIDGVPFEDCDDIIVTGLFCGLGFELVFVIPLLVGLRRWHRSARS